MIRLLSLLAVPLLAALAPTAVAGPGKFNKMLAPGDKAPTWENLEGTDGKKHSLADFKDKEIVVVVFTCNGCPVAKDYEDRIIAFAKTHAGSDSKVAFVAINVNTGKEDSLPAMKVRAEKKKFPFPYLYDPTQDIARNYGAMFTPEFFVLDKERKVLYTGSMDDKSPPEEPKSLYLELAVKAALAGKKIDTPETAAAAGCKIKFNPKKDD
ncbi:MAG: thioredoxin family protein [Planctomycetes bacterium]|nr:thioredoxin family protein [Planctomycetota bacterium]